MRISVAFRKKVPGSSEVLDVPGTLEATFQEVTAIQTIMILGDARDEGYRRVDISGDTEIIIPIPIIHSEPHIRLSCGCLVKHPGLGGHVVRCEHKTWAVRSFDGETTIIDHGDWSKA